MKESLYDVLEVSRTASPEVIRAAYKSLVQRYHPDKNPDNPDAENLLKLINHAYETLSDPATRSAYDVMLTLEEMAHAPAQERAEEPEPAAEPEGDRDFAEKWDLYQTYIGKNPNYYRAIFRRFDHSGKTGRTFNWSALIAGGAWAGYRKLYLPAILHLVLFAAGISIVRIANGPLGFAALAPFFLMSVWLSFHADSLYFRHVSRKIGEIADRENETAAVFRKLHLAGGVNPLAPFVFAGLMLISLLASNWLSPSPQPKRIVLLPPQRIEPPAPPAPPVQPEVLPMPSLPPVEEPKPAEKPVEKPKPAETRPSRKPAAKPAEKPVENAPAESFEKPVQPPPSPRPPAGVQGYADLATAVSFGDKAAVVRMIREGEDVNQVRNNQVPLIIAVKNGDIEMVRLLLSKGADVNQTDNQGNTAMIYAKVRADAKMIDLLKHAGAKNPFD